MSYKKLLDYRLKQKILYIDKTSSETLVRYGDSCMEESALSDALDFYSKAAHLPGLQKIMDLALQNGDTFLFQRAAKALNKDIQPADWEAVGRHAMELKKFTFAQFALEKANNAELLGLLTTTMKAEA